MDKEIFFLEKKILKSFKLNCIDLRFNKKNHNVYAAFAVLHPMTSGIILFGFQR